MKSIGVLHICLTRSVGRTGEVFIRFRSGCHGLRVNTGQWEGNVHLDWETGYVWCAILPKLWRLNSIFSLIVLLMLLLGSECNFERSFKKFQQGCAVEGFLSKTECNACGVLLATAFILGV